MMRVHSAEAGCHAAVYRHQASTAVSQAARVINITDLRHTSMRDAAAGLPIFSRDIDAPRAACRIERVDAAAQHELFSAAFPYY